MHHMKSWADDPYYPELRHAAIDDGAERAERRRADRARRRQRRLERWRSLVGRTDLT